MTPAALQRTALPLTLDLVRRLSADYADLPVATVVRCLDAARSAVRYFGEGLDQSLSLVERLARADLDAIRSEAGQALGAGSPESAAAV